jgi:tetratricopeptide (TPR) repeat protein
MVRAAASLVFACLLLLAPASRADQTDARLPDLFARLKAAPTEAAADPIEAEIWNIWTDAEDTELDRLMGEGIAAMNARDPKTALEDFTKLTRLAPDFAEGWNKRATLLYLLGQYEASMADIDRTLALEPRHFGALSGLGLIQMTLEHDEEALDAFERALAIHPQMSGPRANVELLKERLKGKTI